MKLSDQRHYPDVLPRCGLSLVGQVAVAMQGDVSKEADVEASVRHCVERFGHIECYFANAGIMPQYTSISDTSEANEGRGEPCFGC